MPPPIVLSAGVPIPPALYVGTVKSSLMAYTTVLPFMTVIVHEIASFTRTTVVDALTCPTHDSTELLVGVSAIKNVNGLPLTAALLLTVFSVTWNDDVLIVGAVNTKEKLVPKLVVARDGVPLAPSPLV